MKILVTGGCGFIGANFIHYWLKTHPNDSIINLDCITYAGNLASLSDIAENIHYTFIKGDICDKEKVFEITKDIDLIVNFAGESHVDRSIDGALPFIKTNIEGTLVLLEAARENGNIRFHHVSTDEVFGDLPLNKPYLKFNERSCFHPRSPYAASKAAAEHLALSFFHTHKLPVTISNCSNNYGPYQHPEKLIPLTITRALTNEKIPLYGDGKQVRDWIHVVDHCRAIDCIINKAPVGSSYLVGGESERSNRWIMSYILEKLGKTEDLIAHVGDRKGHDVRYAIDMTKIKSDLGFSSSKTIDEGLDETIDWYVANQSWWQPTKKAADAIAEKYLTLAYA